MAVGPRTRATIASLLSFDPVTVPPGGTATCAINVQEPLQVVRLWVPMAEQLVFGFSVGRDRLLYNVPGEAVSYEPQEGLEEWDSPRFLGIPVDCPPVVPGLQLSLDVDNPTPLARRVAGAVFVLYERSRSEPPLPPPMPQEALEAFATRLRAAESLDTVAVLADLLSQRTERRKEMETGTHHDALRFVESPTAIHCPRCRRTHADASQTVSDGGAGRFSCGHCGARFLARTADAPPRRFRAEEQEP